MQPALGTPGKCQLGRVGTSPVMNRPASIALVQPWAHNGWCATCSRRHGLLLQIAIDQETYINFREGFGWWHLQRTLLSFNMFLCWIKVFR